MNFNDMNLGDLIKQVEAENPELAERLRALIPVGYTGDLTALKVQMNFRLEKFEGEWTPESRPFEVIEGGDDRQTIVTRF